MPILPGKTHEFEQFVREISGARQKEYDASQKRKGYSRQYVCLASTSAGDLAVVYEEAESLARADELSAAANEPFDLWFRQQLMAVHGTIPVPGKALLDWKAS